MAQQRSTSQRQKTSLQVFDPQPGVTYSLEALCHMTGVPRREVLIYCRQGLIQPVSSSEREPMSFGEESLYLIRRIQYLRNTHGVNLAGIRLVFNLVRELERLREEMRFLR